MRRELSPLYLFLANPLFFPPLSPLSPPTFLLRFFRLYPEWATAPPRAADAVHFHPSWFYLGEVIPTPLPLKTALELRQANEDLAAAPSAVTTAAPKKDLSGVKRVVKNKGGKGAGKNALSGLGPGGDGIAGEVGQRKTRGKKLKLPAGEGGPDEDDFDDEDGEYSEATGGAGASRAPSEAGMDVDA